MSNLVFFAICRVSREGLNYLRVEGHWGLNICLLEILEDVMAFRPFSSVRGFFISLRKFYKISQLDELINEEGQRTLALGNFTRDLQGLVKKEQAEITRLQLLLREKERIIEADSILKDRLKEKLRRAEGDNAEEKAVGNERDNGGCDTTYAGRVKAGNRKKSW